MCGVCVRACLPVCMRVRNSHFADDIPDSTCDWPEPKWKTVEGKKDRMWSSK